MSLNLALLKEICESSGAPGFEKQIRNLVMGYAHKYVDKITVDNMGNLMALKKGKSSDKKVMVAAHLDEIGFIVTHIDENGFLRFHTLGGFDAKTLTAQRVIVHGKRDLIGVMGAKPIHVMTPEERKALPKITDYFIDLGLPAKEVHKLISVGDPVTRERELIEMGECVNGKSLDNRISVFVLLETLRLIKNPPYDVYGVFTVQEEVGIQGATVATQKIQPDFGIGLDTTIAFDVPGSKPHERITALGKGAAIKVMDASTICDYRMVEFMKKTAERHKIEWQSEILTAGGTDTAGLQRQTAGGSIAGAISIPTRNLHQVIEMCNKSDIKGAIDLLSHCLQEIDEFDWEHK